MKTTNYDQLPAQLQQALGSHNPPLDTPEKLREFRQSGKSWTDIPGVGAQYAQLLE